MDISKSASFQSHLTLHALTLYVPTLTRSHFPRSKAPSAHTMTSFVRGPLARARSPFARASQSEADPGTDLGCGMVQLPPFSQGWINYKRRIACMLEDITFRHHHDIFGYTDTG